MEAAAGRLGGFCLLIILLAACHGNIADAPGAPVVPHVAVADLSGPGGNALDHEAAFACTPETVAATSSRLVRLGPEQYHRTMVEVVGGELFRSLTRGAHWNAFDVESPHRFSTHAADITIDEATFDALLLTSGRFADFMTRPGPTAHPAPADYIEPCVVDASPYTADCADRVVGELLRRAFRRPPSEDERARYVALVEREVGRLGKSGAFRAAFEAAMLAPETLFRSEIGGGEIDAHGRRRLTQYEMASAIAFAVGNEPPDDRLLGAAARSELHSRLGIRDQVQRLLLAAERDEPEAQLLEWRQQFAVPLRFVRELFRYPRAEGAFKDDPEYERYLRGQSLLYPEEALIFAFKPKIWVNRTDDWVLTQLATRRGFFSRLLKELDEEGRWGLMSQRSFLVTHTQASENDPIRRGRFVYETLLCNDLPELPLDVVPALPEMEDATLRERLAAHTGNPSCVGCHQYMDPIGLGFEEYHHYLGDTRRTEQDRPVDSSGVLVGSTDSDGPFDGVAELSVRLADSDRARQCFLRQAFRFWMGRNELRSDACTLREMDDTYIESGGDFVDVLMVLLASDSHRMRVAEEGL